MATYKQWRAGISAGLPAVRRLTWVCGPEAPLAAEVVTEIRALVSASPFGTALFLAGEDDEADIWAACGQYPAEGERRLVVVRAAQLLSSFTALAELASAGREFAGAYLLFVSDLPRYDSKAGGKRVMQPGPAVVQQAATGQIVHCVLGAQEARVAWVQSRLPGLGANLAWLVLDECGDDLTAAAAVCAKALCWPEAMRTEPLFRELCGHRVAGTFTDNLILGRKAAALAALPSAGELGAVIGLLGSRLDTLAVLYGAAAQTPPASPAEVERKLGIHRLLRARYQGVARVYNPALVRRCWRLLAEADAAYRSGEREGVVEVLAACW